MSPLVQSLVDTYEKPIIIVMVGLPRSGKTTWAQKQDIPIVDVDAARKSIHGLEFNNRAERLVWPIVCLMVEALIQKHPAIILETNNTQVQHRKKWVSNDWQVIYKPIPVDVETALQRARNSGWNMLEALCQKIRTMPPMAEPIQVHEGPVLDTDDNLVKKRKSEFNFILGAPESTGGHGSKKSKAA